MISVSLTTGNSTAGQPPISMGSPARSNEPANRRPPKGRDTMSTGAVLTATGNRLLESHGCANRTSGSTCRRRPCGCASGVFWLAATRRRAGSASGGTMSSRTSVSRRRRLEQSFERIGRTRLLRSKEGAGKRCSRCKKIGNDGRARYGRRIFGALSSASAAASATSHLSNLHYISSAMPATTSIRRIASTLTLAYRRIPRVAAMNVCSQHDAV